MSKNEQQKQIQLDPKRIEEYNKAFKIPIQNMMSDISQMVPNVLDQFTKQCIALETELDTVRKERDSLLLEKTTVKTPKTTEVPQPKK